MAVIGVLSYFLRTRQSQISTYEKNVVDAWDGLNRDILASVIEVEKLKEETATLLAEKMQLQEQQEEQLRTLANKVAEVEFLKAQLKEKHEEINSLKEQLPSHSSSNSFN